MDQTLADELELVPLGGSRTDDSSTDHSGLDYHGRYQVGRTRSIAVGLSRIS
jgi:hypothetical protein